MSDTIPWTEEVMEAFIKSALLTKDEAFIVRTRVDGWTVTKQAGELHVSNATVHRMVERIRKKYDRVQAEHPEKFPKRVSSTKELYMDTH